MKLRARGLLSLPALVLALGAALPATAATTIQLGDSGKSFASSAVQCAIDPQTGESAPMVEAGLVNPRRNASAVVLLNDGWVADVTAAAPVAQVWLAEGANDVAVVLGKKTTDHYRFDVAAGQCALPDTSGNTFSPDGTLEYGASGRSYATVDPGCALNGATGQTQWYVNVFNTGDYLLNISLNGTPLKQIGPVRTHTPVFLAAGINVISVAYGSLSTDYYVRDGGTGACVLAQ